MHSLLSLFLAILAGCVIYIISSVLSQNSGLTVACDLCHYPARTATRLGDAAQGALKRRALQCSIAFGRTARRSKRLANLTCNPNYGNIFS